MASQLVPVSCPICANMELVRISNRGQHNLPTFVSICPNDGMVFLSPRWTDDRYREFYRYEYDELYRSTDTSETNRINAYTIASRLPIENNMSILEIGAGDGDTLKHIGTQHSGIEAHAIESSEACLSSLNDSGVHIVSNDAMDLDSVEKYDIIIMRHTLEHFLYPNTMLQKIHTALKPDGIVYIAVPDMLHPAGSLDRHWFRAVHTYYYSRMTLIQLLHKHGFTYDILNRNSHEIWGMFRKNHHDYILVDSGVYKEQMRVIRRQKLKSIFYNMIRR